MSKSRELHPVINFGLVPLLQLILAFLVVGLLIVLIEENPVQAVQLYVTDVLMSQVGLGQSIFYATTLIFTGMAVALAFHAGLFNIGGEGQGMFGGIGLTFVALIFMGHFTGGVGFDLPGFIMVPLLFIAAAIGGAAWAAIPGYLQAYRGSHLVITTIMFNAIAFSIILFLLTGWFQNPDNPGDPKSPLLPEQWWLWKVGDYYQYRLIDLEAQYKAFKDSGPFRAGNPRSEPCVLGSPRAGPQYEEQRGQRLVPVRHAGGCLLLVLRLAHQMGLRHPLHRLQPDRCALWRR